MTKLAPHNEEGVSSLLDRCKQRDEDAWRILVHRYKGLVYTTALRTGLDDEGAREVYQRVWVELFASLDRIRIPDALPGWLAVATRRLAYKYAVASARMVDGVFDEMVDPAALPDQEIEALQVRSGIERALTRLGEPCARLLRLLFLDSQQPSYQQIAESAGIAMGSIGPTRARCLRRLRKIMEASA